MKKNQILIIAIVLILILWGIVHSIFLLKEKAQNEGVVEEVFSLVARVSRIDLENNFLIVKSPGKENEIKVILSDATKLIRLEDPFDPENPPPPGTQFTPKKTEITLENFKIEENILIRAKENIAGQSEISNIDFIHILP